MLVAEDGRLVARTVRIDSWADTAYFLEELLIDDLSHEVITRVGLTPMSNVGRRVNDILGTLSRAIGQPVIEVRYWDVCTGPGQKPGR